MKQLLVIAILVTSILLSGFPLISSPAFAQPGSQPNKSAPSIYGGQFANPEASDRYSTKGLADTVLPGIARWIAGFLGAIAVLFLIWAGIQFLTAEGDPEKISKASKTAFYVLGGVLLVMFAYAIVALFIGIFSA